MFKTLFLPCLAGVIQHAQPGREARRLLFPVKDQGFRNDCERRGDIVLSPCLGRILISILVRLKARFAPSAQLAPRFEQREHLYGLSQSHIVRKAAAESELAQKIYPAQAV